MAREYLFLPKKWWADMTTTDARFCYGAGCTWYGPIQNVGKSAGGLPCCPVCSGMLYEYATAEVWWKTVDAYEANSRPGYRAFVEWLGTRHFPDYGAASAAYRVATGLPTSWSGLSGLS